MEKTVTASRTIFLAVLICLTVAAAEPARAADSPSANTNSDAFIGGYAAAVLDREVKVEVKAISVTNGVITVTAPDLNEAQRRQLAIALSSIDGVVRVEIAPVPADSDIAASAKADTPALLEHTTTPPESTDALLKSVPAGYGNMTPALRPESVFDPLLADPRWPHMAASYQQYENHANGKDIGAVSFGGRTALRKGETQQGDPWELGIQAGVFAAFDMASDSQDLLNADYTVGFTLTGRRDDLSMLVRLLHQSSHLGDEFLLENPDVQRYNYSFESVDVIISRDFCDRTVRIYGGGRFRFDVDPGDLDHWSVQYGAEWSSGSTYANGLLRPIAATDLQHHQQNEWEADVSVRAGVQIEHPDFDGHIWQILAEYYNGHSPHGQFFADRVQYVGIGVHFYY